jgi:hypothetical protein
MQESNFIFANTSPEDPIRSDLSRVDAHVVQPEEYDEIPEITEEDLARSVIRRPGLPDKPFLAQQSQGS